MASREELVITALQQRIGELVSNYETQMAILRAEITDLVTERNAKSEAVQEFSEHISNLSD
jgi:uncharacterized small protein (DUF1192 family)